MRLLPRTAELEFLKQLLNSDNPEFTYVRGRRRIGKSWLLQDLSEFAKGHGIAVLTHAGSADASPTEAMLSFIWDFEKASNSNKLSQIRKNLLTWRMIFDEVIEWSKRIDAQNQSALIVIDEVQWVAVGKKGFVGTLKDAWIRFERETKSKIIICGSSERFFSEMTGGEEKILRGIATTAPLLVPPFSNQQTREVVPTEWSLLQILLLQMMTGGIPYYLAAVVKNSSLGFSNAVNLAFFSKTSKLITENEEMLGLEFRANRQSTASLILTHLCLSRPGLTLMELARRIGSTTSTIQDVVDKLIEYKLVAPKINLAQAKPLDHYRGMQGTTFAVKDPFLYFYYKVMEPLKSRIKANEGRENLFISLCQQEYILGYSGYAFENLILRSASEPSNSLVRQKLGMTFNCNYALGSGYLRVHPGRGRTAQNLETNLGNRDKIKSQIDVVIRGEDGIVRVIECKWTNEERLSHLDEVISKKIELSPNETRLNVLAMGYKPSVTFKDKAKEMKVVLIEPEDFFN